MNTARYVYNNSLGVMNLEKKEGIENNFQSLRNKLVTRKPLGVLNENIKEWELETPKDIRAESIRDMIKARSIAFINLKKGNIHHFKMRFRKKKTWKSISINEAKYENKRIFFYTTFLGMKQGIRVAKDKSLKDVTINHASRIIFKRGEWYIHIPQDVKCDEEEHEKEHLCAIDPGSSTFDTIYSEDKVVKIQQDKEIIKKLQKKLDFYCSLRDKQTSKSKTKRQCKKSINKIYKKIDCFVDELHFKTIRFLKTNYKWILLPSFESQEMVKKGFNKKFNRNMLQLKHYKFKERLKASCSLDPTTTLNIVMEDYTSKTCGGCGWIKNNLGGGRTFKCDECKLVIDRDINGARNIAIKYLVGSNTPKGYKHL
jgi:putative transposase